jgi:hypothetical protein
LIVKVRANGICGRDIVIKRMINLALKGGVTRTDVAGMDTNQFMNKVQ